MVPDIAYINIGVHTEKPTAADAVAENNTQTQQVVDALQSGLRIAAGDLGSGLARIVVR